MKTSILAVLCTVLPLASPARAQDADRLKELEARIEKLETAPASPSISAFNPAMGMSLDLVTRHDNGRGRFDFRSAEISVEAPVDPYLKAWAVVNGDSDRVEVEEATLQTTSLPGNLTVRGGRLFASFGRLPHFHDHELPVTDRPASIDTYIGGESRADGVEVEYLFPLKTYLSATLGAYDKLGAENERQDDSARRAWDQMTYLGRLSTYADIGDNSSAELGVSAAWTPRRTVVEDVAVTGGAEPAVTTGNTWRALAGLDFTYRYQPAEGGLYKGVVWGTEVLVNNERRFNASTLLPADRVKAFGGYSFVWLKVGRHWRPGALVDLSEDLDQAHELRRTLTAFLTYDVSEFQRLRASYSAVSDNVAGNRDEHRVALQWSAVIGRHVHGYRDR